MPKLQTKHRLITIFISLSVLITVRAAGFFSDSHVFDIVKTTAFASPDTLLSKSPDTLNPTIPDTLDYNVPDSLLVSQDSNNMAAKTDKFMLSAKIDYASADSLSMDIKNKMAWMYGNASIDYEDINLKAAIISINFETNTIHAYPTYDTLGNPVGMPEFKQGDLSFKSKEIAYNFTTRKGLIQNVITKEGEGYIHGTVIKKINDSVTDVGKGEYTTCDLDENPHFSLKFTKAKVIAGSMIVTGPAYISVEGVPLPLALPFGLFPNKKGRSSGLIIPKYGESADRGFFLEDGGYYFGLNDYFDLKLVGDIYSRGSWAIKPALTYKKRYKFSGNFSLRYAVTKTGTEGSKDYMKRNDFFVTWSHRQDPKARPNSVFGASVNAGSSSYNKYNPSSVNDYLTNTFSSSVSYDLRLGTWGNLTSSATHSQNTQTHWVNLSLPSISFGINRLYPFKPKVQVGPAKWYESINVTYSMNMRNDLSSADSMVFKSDVGSRFVNGMKHTIPLTGSFKVLKYFSWSNTLNYNERWVLKTIRKSWVEDTAYSVGGFIDIDTINGFKSARDYSFSSSLNTTIYGMKQFKKGPVRAIRHVVRPSVGFSFTPDFGTEQLGYWKTVQTNANGTMADYSIFEGNSIVGSPSNQKSGAINFGLGNNLEMKVRSLKDTVTGTKKVMIIDNFNISTSYDLARDSLRWQPLNLSATTTLFKKIQIRYSSVYSFYGLYRQPFYGYTLSNGYISPFYSPFYSSTAGPMINTYQYSMNKKLLRLTNAAWNLSFGFELPFKKEKADKKKEKVSPDKEQELEDILTNPDLYMDWNNPWSLRADYNFSLASVPDLTTEEIKRTIIQTFRVSGDLSVTPKWKVTMQTGYDFQQKDFAFTQITINRDLHCWEMRFSWIPYGNQKSWNFQINAKSSLLQDLKLTRKKDFRDNL
jgi:lipopolysaccharide assembly outer membrane protein LptD (OstA)